MSLFYTGNGDNGKSQIGKKRVSKDSPVIETLGDLDELNSLLGLIRTFLNGRVLSLELKNIQENLFIVQARIAWIMYPNFKAPSMAVSKIKDMEKKIDAIEKKIKPKRGFVVMGSTKNAAWLDYARTVARRAERSTARLHRKHVIPKEILTYLNRLSSYLYALAREETAKEKIKESNPSYK